MNDDALMLDDQHKLNTQNIKNNATVENSESSSSFKSFDFDSNSVLEQFLCFSPPTSVQNSDSDPEYFPSKKTNKSAHPTDDHPKSTCRRSARLSTFKDDENSTRLFSLPLATSKDPEYFPPKGILYALKKSVNDSVPKSDIITNVKQRKLRRSKKFVDPACNSCISNSHEKFSMSCHKVKSCPDLGMNSSPLSTEQLRQILEGGALEEVSKENTSKEESTSNADPDVHNIPQESVSHDSKGKLDTDKNATLKMPRTRSSLKLKVKKEEKKVTLSISNSAKSNKELSSETSDTSSQHKVSKDKVLPKAHVQKESKKVLKRRKRQTCRKQFRHKDITLYKLGADSGPVNEATQKNQVIHKIFLRRSSVSAQTPSTPQSSKVNKNEEVSENLLLGNTNSNSDKKCSENLTVKENNSFKVSSSNCDLNKTNQVYSSSISIENHNMNKVPKVILTPINTKENYYTKGGTLKDKKQVVPQLQIKEGKIEELNSAKKQIGSQQITKQNEIGKHNLPIRIPERRRTSIAEPLRTPPAPNNKVPSFHIECQPENQLNYMKIEIKNGLSDNPEIIYIKPTNSQEKSPEITKCKETLAEPSTIVCPSAVGEPLHNDSTQSNTVQVNKQDSNGKEKGNLPVIDVADKTAAKEVSNNHSNIKPTQNYATSERNETNKNVFQETQEAYTFSGPQNLSIKVVKSCSGITDPLKLHKTNNLPTKKSDSDAKSKVSKVSSVATSKENHYNNYQRTDDTNYSVNQTTSPISSNVNEISHKNSPILQQNLLNGLGYKSDMYRNNIPPRGNISMNNFNPEVSPYALNSLATSHTCATHSSTVSGVPRNMPIIEETNQQTSNNRVAYETITNTSEFIFDSSKRQKKGKRKMPRSDLYDDISPKVQRSNNYPNYPNYNYLPFYPGAPPNPSYNPLPPPFPLGIPHSVYNVTSPLYQPKTSTVQSPTFESPGFRGAVPPSIMNPFMSHEARFPVPAYPTVNPPVSSKTYDSRIHYNRLMRFSNPMFMNHNTLASDYGCVGTNSRRNETLTQNSNSVLQQGFDFSSRNFVRNAAKQSPPQTFSNSENTHRQSTEATQLQNAPLALVKNAAETQCSDWDSIPIISRNEELTITKLPLRENLPKPIHALISAQACSKGNQIEDLTLSSKHSECRQNDGNNCSIVAISKSNTKIADSSGYPCNKTNVSEYRGGMGNVLHNELANVSISLIRNKNEKEISPVHNKPTSFSQPGLLPILERAKLLNEEQHISIPHNMKMCEANNSNSYPTAIQTIQPTKTLNLSKNDRKIESNIYTTISETKKDIADEKTDYCNSYSNNIKTVSPANIFRDVELEINCTKITKPTKTMLNENTTTNNYYTTNTKISLDNIYRFQYNDTEKKLENKSNKTISNKKVDHTNFPSTISESGTTNTEKELENKTNSSVVTIIPDTECELDSPNDGNKSVEATNLFLNKSSKSSTATTVFQNENISTLEAVLRHANNSPKAGNYNTIANTIQDIIHQGDVKKFDLYVETLRRSFENHGMCKLNVTKEICSEKFYENIVDLTKASNTKNTDKVNTTRSEQVFASIPKTIAADENTSKPYKTTVSQTAATSECKVINSSGLKNTDSENGNTLIFQSSIIPEQTNAQVLQNVKLSQSDGEFRNSSVSQNEAASDDTNVHVSQTKSVAIEEPSNAVASQTSPIPTHANNQVSEVAVISEHIMTHAVRSSHPENVAASKIIEDSRNVTFSQCDATLKHTNTQTECISEQEVSSLNLKNVSITESTKVTKNTVASRSTMADERVNPQILRSLTAESIAVSTEIAAIEIKKELEEDDDDVIIVYDSFERVAATTEDKGIQADISISPLNTISNSSRTREPKRKKWKFLEARNSIKTIKMNKTRTKRKQKTKRTIKLRSKTEEISLNKQLYSEINQNTFISQFDQNKAPNRQSKNIEMKTKKFKKINTSTASSAKLSQTELLGAKMKIHFFPQVSNKSSKKSATKKKSKRLLEKNMKSNIDKGVKLHRTCSKTGNPQLYSIPRNEGITTKSKKFQQPQSCDSTPPLHNSTKIKIIALPGSLENIENSKSTLRNSEINQPRYVTRLSRSLQNSKTNNNQSSYSNIVNNTEEKTQVNKVNNVGVFGSENDLVQISQESQSLHKTSPKTSAIQSANYIHEGSINEITNEVSPKSSRLNKLSKQSDVGSPNISDSDGAGNQMTNNLILGVQQLPSPSTMPPQNFGTFKHTNNSSKINNKSMQVSQKALSLNKQTSFLPSDNNSGDKNTSAVQMPQILPASNNSSASCQITDNLTSNVATTGNQAVNNCAQTPRKATSLNKLSKQTLISSPNLTASNSVHISQKSPSSNKMSPQISSTLTTNARSNDNRGSNNPVQVPQKSPLSTLPKKISTSATDTQKDVSYSNQSTKNPSHTPQKSLPLNKPSSICAPLLSDATNNQTINNTVQLPQKSVASSKLSKQSSISSSDTCIDTTVNNKKINSSVVKSQDSSCLRETPPEHDIPPVRGPSNDIGIVNNSAQELQNSTPLSKISKQTPRLSPEIYNDASKSNSTTNNSVQLSQKPPTVSRISPHTADILSVKDDSNLAQTIQKSPSLNRSSKQTSNWSTDTQTSASNDNKVSRHSIQERHQSSCLSRTSTQISEIPAISSTDANSGSYTTSSSHQIIDKPHISKSDDNHLIGNPVEVPQQSLNKLSQKTLHSSEGASNNNFPAKSLVQIPQNSPSVTKALPLIEDATNNSIEITKETSSSSRPLSRECNTSSPIPLPRKSPAVGNIPPQMSASNSVKMPQISPSLSRPLSQGSNTTNSPILIPRKSPASRNTSPQISASHSVKPPQISPSLIRMVPQGSNAAATTCRYMNSDDPATDQSLYVLQKSPTSSKMLQQTFSAPTNFYRCSINDNQIENNSTKILSQSPSSIRTSPQFANVASTSSNSFQVPHKTISSSRISHHISKTPPIAHRHANIDNQATSNSVQMLHQSSLWNSITHQFSNDTSDIYAYEGRNTEREIDLTVSSKTTTNREAGKKDHNTPDSKLSKRSCLSKGEDEDSTTSIASNMISPPYQPYLTFHAESVPFRAYPSYPPKHNENRSQNDFGRKIQTNLIVEPSAVSFPTNQEIRQNSQSNSSTSNPQFSPNFRQPSPVLNKLYVKSTNPKQSTEGKNKDLSPRNPNTAFKQHVTYNNDQPSEQTNFCEMQQSGNRHIFTDLKEKILMRSKSLESTTGRPRETHLPSTSHKKRPKEDHNYLNIKAPDAHQFNGNRSPDYGYFSPLTKNAPPNFESVVYRPNPIRFSEPHSYQNMKYRGVSNAPQHPSINTREPYHTPAALPIQNTSSNSTNAYVRQNPKIPTNSSTLPMPNGVPHKVQQPDVDKISSILPKLQQSETLNPEQYVLEMSVLEKDGCPRPFLEFYSFVTKKQIASNQLPISFRIFLEFHNAGKLKNFENAFRIYSERHEKEKKMM